MRRSFCANSKCKNCVLKDPLVRNNQSIQGISIPIAVLIWIMIYPMMLKVDFNSINEVGRAPKGLVVTWIVNWLIKPFTMYAI